MPVKFRQQRETGAGGGGAARTGSVGTEQVLPGEEGGG